MEKRFIEKVRELNIGVSGNKAEAGKQAAETYEISLRLSEYSDIFSDFDPRHYSQRALSDDFLIEIKKISQDKPYEAMELMLLVPKGKKDEKLEAVIRKRLHDHFRRHHELIKEDIRKTVRRGVVISFFGALLMALATYLEILGSSSANLAIKVFGVLTLPAGWFTTWFGLDEIFYSSRGKMPDLVFYEKMHMSKITFYGY